MKPLIREDILTEVLDDEILIYDPTALETHLLRGDAGKVLAACDGVNSAEEIGSGETEAVILCELERLKLLKATSEPLPESVTRRAALATLAKAAVLPLIMTVGVSHPAAAASGPPVPDAVCQAGGPDVCGRRCIELIPAQTRFCGRANGVTTGPCACLLVIDADCTTSCT